MNWAGYTINAPTLMAIGMSVGILVTNSIVVLEAIVKRLDEGLSPREAARVGAGESFIPVLASAGTNVVVLFPLAVMPGMVGLFIAPFAMTMVIVTVVSLFMSFTLTPMMASLLLKPKKEKSRSPLALFGRLWDRVFDFVANLYKGQLQFFERYRVAAVLFMIVVVIIFVHSMKIGGTLGFGMGAEPDRGEISVKLEFPTSYDLARTRENTLIIEEDLRSSLPHLRHMLTTIGKVQGMMGQTSEGVHLAQILLRFNERTERQALEQILNLTRDKLAKYAGVISTLVITNFTGGRVPMWNSKSAARTSVPSTSWLEAQKAAYTLPDFVTWIRQRGKASRTAHQARRAVLADLDFAPAMFAWRCAQY